MTVYMVAATTYVTRTNLSHRRVMTLNITNNGV